MFHSFTHGVEDGQSSMYRRMKVTAKLTTAGKAERLQKMKVSSSKETKKPSKPNTAEELPSSKGNYRITGKTPGEIE